MHRANANIRKPLIAFLDSEFVHLRRRQKSLAVRYSDVFSTANLANLFYLSSAQEIFSALATQQFQWQAAGRQWQGAMVGFVHTAREHQGRGHAATLLREVAVLQQTAGMDFLVLWTAQPDYYAELGWRRADPGAVAECAGDAAEVPIRGEPLAAMSAAMRVQLQTISDQSGHFGVAHACRPYTRLPFPAAQTELLLAGRSDAKRAFALVGQKSQLTTVFEMVGHADCFSELWDKIVAGRRQVRVNAAGDGSAARWLAKTQGIVWQPKPLAMYLPLSPRFSLRDARSWYVPYIDRI